MIRNPAVIADTYNSCTVELRELAYRDGLSSYVTLSELLTKSLLLTCASYYEAEIVDLVRGVVRMGAHRSDVCVWLNRVAVEGQFFRWFNFRGDTRNTNNFLSTFGSDFKSNMRELIDRSERRKYSETCFLELCRKRNECVHRNFVAYSLDLTIDEVYERHVSAMTFIRAVDIGIRSWLLPSSVSTVGRVES